MNLYDTNREYKGTITGRTRDGTMDLQFFKNSHNNNHNVRIPNHYNYMLGLAKDRAFTGNTKTTYETPPNNHTSVMEQKLDLLMYGARNTKDPYTEEGIDSQFRTRDPRGFNLATPWEKGLEMSRKFAENYDYAPTGDINYDSGTAPPDLLQEKLKNMFYAFKAIYKNFVESLVNPRPYGPLKRDESKVPTLRYAGEMGHDFPIPKEDANRRVIPQVDVKFRSQTKPSHVVNDSVYGLGIKASGLTSLKNQINEILFRSPDPQLENEVYIQPPQPKVMESLLKNSLVIDKLLDEQMQQDNRANSWIHSVNSPLQKIVEDDNIEKKELTLLPNVYGVIPARVNFGGSKYNKITDTSVVSQNKVPSTYKISGAYNKNMINDVEKFSDAIVNKNTLLSKQTTDKQHIPVFSYFNDNVFISENRYNKAPVTNNMAKNTLYRDDFNQSFVSTNMGRSTISDITGARHSIKAESNYDETTSVKPKCGVKYRNTPNLGKMVEFDFE